MYYRQYIDGRAQYFIISFVTLINIFVCLFKYFWHEMK